MPPTLRDIDDIVNAPKAICRAKTDFEKDTHMIKVDVLAGSLVYMPANYDNSDRAYIKTQFWDQRWWRWGHAAGIIALWALIPCALIFILGYALLWVGRGFKRA